MIALAVASLAFTFIALAIGVYNMATQAEFTAALNELTAQVAKVKTESEATKVRVEELEAALENSDQEISAEVQSAFDALKAQVQSVDDVVADVPAVPAPPAG